MFDPRILQDPILMALLQAAQGGGQQGGMPAPQMPMQSNPNIVQGADNVWRNTVPSHEPPALPFLMPGDYSTEQYLQQLSAEAAARQKEQEYLQKVREAEFAHKDAMELEGTKQKGSTERQMIQSQTEIEKQKFSSIGSILNNENLQPDQKLAAIQQLVSMSGNEGGGTDLKKEAATLVDSIKQYNAITTPQGRAEKLKTEAKESGGVVQASANTWDQATGFYNQPGKLKDIATLPIKGLSQLSTIGKQLGSAPQDLAAFVRNEKFSTADPAQENTKIKLATDIATKLVMLGKADGMTTQEIVAFAKAKGIKDQLILDLIGRMQ